VFVLPVDTPAPRVEHWERLAGSDIPAHPVFGERGGHPLYLPSGWIENRLGALVTAARGAGVGPEALSLRLDKLIAGSSRRVAVDDPGVVVNMNEPADVETWLESGEPD
jgi:CTP:molybdopterin cytidylyltransferase MocA